MIDTSSTSWSSPPRASAGQGFDLAGDVLVVRGAGEDGERATRVRGLDVSTGQVRWTAPSAGRAGTRPPISADGGVYLSVYEGPTQAYDIATGALRWTHGVYPYAPHPVAARGPDAYLYDWRTGFLHAVVGP